MIIQAISVNQVFVFYGVGYQEVVRDGYIAGLDLACKLLREGNVALW